MPEPNKRARHYSIVNRYKLEATAYKTVYDGYYEGKIYKPGCDDVYTHNLTVEYEEDNLDIYEMHSTEWTNKDLNITLSSDSYFFNLFKFDALCTYVKPSTFSVSKMVLISSMYQIMVTIEQ